MIQTILNSLRPHVLHRIWIFSDLQQSLPERATYCMTRAVTDFQSLHLPVDAVCYLGDAVEGDRPEFLQAMTDMQISELSKIDAPIYYVLGNHDFDYFRGHAKELSGMSIPFYEKVLKTSQWHAGETIEDMSFVQDFKDFALVFLPDHAARDGSWFTTHGIVHGNENAYPYDENAYTRLRKSIEDLKKPVFTLSHYSFAGGNRADALFDRLLPLPDNVRMHFYGHAHIGDAVWAGKDCYRQIAAVDNQPLVQINVASLENFRGTAIRSVLFEWYDDASVGIYFRNHTARVWDHIYLTRSGAQVRKTDE